MLKSTIIRVLAFAALFAYVLPFAFNAVGLGASFAFTGGVAAAFGISVAYMAVMFAVVVVLGSCMSVMGMTVKQRTAAWPFTSLACFLVTTGALIGFSQIPLLALTVSIPAALIGSGVAMGLLYVTMPKASEQ